MPLGTSDLSSQGLPTRGHSRLGDQRQHRAKRSGCWSCEGQELGAGPHDLLQSPSVINLPVRGYLHYPTDVGHSQLPPGPSLGLLAQGWMPKGGRVYAELRSGRGGEQAGVQTQLSPGLGHLDQVAKLTWPQFPLL